VTFSVVPNGNAFQATVSVNVEIPEAGIAQEADDGRQTVIFCDLIWCAH